MFPRVPTNGRHLPCARRPCFTAAISPQPRRHPPATSKRPNTPTRPGRGGGPLDPATLGPTTSPLWNGAMRTRPAKRYFKQLFALYAGLVSGR